MDVEPELTWEGLEPSSAVATQLHDAIGKLEKHHGRLTACHVAVRAPQDHRQSGGHYEVRIRVTVPGRPDVVVNRDPAGARTHAHIEVAIRDAFAAADRQLRDSADKATDRGHAPGDGRAPGGGSAP